jgi:hypothetical protein
MAKIKFENGVTVNFNGNPTEKDVEEIAKKLNLSKVAKDKSFLRKVGDVFTSSTQKFGATIGGTAALGGQQKMLEEESGQNFEQAQKLVKAIGANKKAGKDTSNLERIYKDLTGSLPSIEELNPTINTTAGQLAGQALGTVVEATGVGTLKGVKGIGLATELAKTAGQAEKAKLAFKALPMAGKLGSIAKTAGKEALALAPVGYGADVANKLQEGKTGVDAFTPGLGTALSVGIPGALGAKKAVSTLIRGGMEAGAPGVINSLVKPLLKDFSYGKNPGRAVAEMGITANSLDDLAGKIGAARQTVGQEIGSLADEFTSMAKKTGKKSVPLTVSVKSNVLSSIDDAMKNAAKNNDQTVLNRLQDAKRALTENLSLKKGKTGPSIVSKGPVKLDNMTYQEALDFKRKIGDITKWTGNASDDKAVNKTLKTIYGKVKEAMDNAASKAGPEKAARLRKLNQQFADLSSAEIATKYRDKIAERQNLIGLTSHLGAGTAAIGTLLATGGAAFPAVLAGLTGAALDKAFGSTAFKTRLAAWMAKESPGVVERVLAQNPQLREMASKVLTKSIGGTK